MRRVLDYEKPVPPCELVEPGERHWDVFRQLCIDTDTRGPRVADAWFAALAIEQAEVDKLTQLIAKNRERETAEILKQQTIEVANRQKEAAIADKEKDLMAV